MARRRPGGESPPERDSPAALKSRALRLLARREHTRVELQRRLASHAASEADVAHLLDELTERGWLSERRVAEQVIHSRRDRYGSRRIRQELLTKGVAEDVISDSLSQLKETDLNAARKVWRRKFGEAPRNAAERARQVRFMLGRGFALDTVLAVIKSRGMDDEHC